MTFVAKQTKKSYRELTHTAGKTLKETKRGLFPSPAKAKMPKMPEPLPLTVTLGAQRADGVERRRRRKGRTIFAGGRPTGAAPVAQMGLLTKFGGR